MVIIAEEETKNKAEETDGKIECPTCGAKVDPDTSECPECGEKLGEEKKSTADEEEKTESDEDEDVLADDEKPSSSGFWAGVIIFLIGIAIAFGIWLQYTAKIDIPGIKTDYTHFGSLKIAIALVGVIIFLIGFGIIVVSMRKPAVENEDEPEPEEEEEEETEEKPKKEEKEEDEEDVKVEKEEEEEEEKPKKKE